MVRPLVVRFGDNEVYDVWMKTLGYPPTWNPGIEDVLVVQDTLEKG